MAMCKFHLVIVNKFNDVFSEIVLAEKADAAVEKAEKAFVAKCKSVKAGEKTTAHYKLFANPLEATAYVATVKGISAPVVAPVEVVVTKKEKKKTK